MNEYSIHVANGKVVGDSAFYILSHESLGREIKRLENFTDALDKNPALKKEQIAEYKCAKYRYAAVSLIHSTVYNNNIEYSHYLLQPFDEIFKECTEYVALYESVPVHEKPDFSLYYAVLAFTERKLAELRAESQNASDWEKVELEERLGGLNFAKACLNEAWQRRKEVIE